MPDAEVLARASAFDPTQRITAIPTTYKGITFRSRTEARWSIFFTVMGIEWEYEPEGLELENGARYLPDFYLPRFGWWVEVKPTGEILQQERKAITFCIEAGLALLLLVGGPDCKEYDSVCGEYPGGTFCLDTDYHATDDENRFWSCGECVGKYGHEYSDKYKLAILAARSVRF
jgi:hypothetical protein